MIRYLRVAPSKELVGIALVRLDFNTRDEWRMEASLPTLRFLLKTAQSIVIVSHRGRPEGVTLKEGIPSGFKKEWTLRRDAKKLALLLKRKVEFIPHFRFKEIRKKIENAPYGTIYVCENLRFLPGEEKNSASFAKQLAMLGDYYVNDAFAVSHRDNASVSAITKFLPSFAGLEFEDEIRHLGNVMKHPKKPLVMVFGGAKAGDKLPVISYFRSKADFFLLAGALGNTMLRAKGLGVGESLYEKHAHHVMEDILRYKSLELPLDYAIKDEKILDVGPKTVKYFGAILEKAKTIIWNGPLGFIEDPAFSKGTLSIARAIAKNRQAFSVVGGGETVMFLKRYGLDKKFSFTSTGGGAMLEFLAGKKLPGIEALKKQ